MQVNSEEEFVARVTVKLLFHPRDVKIGVPRRSPLLRGIERWKSCVRLNSLGKWREPLIGKALIVSIGSTESIGQGSIKKMSREF